MPFQKGNQLGKLNEGRKNKPGQGFQKGHIVSLETRKKLSKAHKGKSLSREHRLKISRANMGRTVSAITRAKIGKANKINSTGKTGKLSSKWKGGKILQSGYWRIYRSKHPMRNSRNYVKQSHLVVEKHIKRYLTKDEIVHHINGKKDDDRPENLYIFPSLSKHISYHHLKHKPILKSNLHSLE